MYFVKTYMKDVPFLIFCKSASFLRRFTWYWVWFHFTRKTSISTTLIERTALQLQNERRDNSHFFIFVTSKETFIVGLVVVVVVCVCCAHHARLICIRLISPTCLKVDFCKVVQKKFRTFFFFFAKKCEKCKLI